MESELLYKGLYNDDVIDISFVIPTYKQPIYLRKTISSIMNNNISNFKYEIIVVNNDPSEDMSGIIEYFRSSPIKFYRNKTNYGQVGNMNQCVLLAKGKFISFVHDDDFILENYSLVISQYIHSDYDCIIPDYFSFYKSYQWFSFKRMILNTLFLPRLMWRRTLQRVNYDDYIKSFHNVYGPPTCGTLFRKQALEDFGYFKDQMKAAWDYDNFREFNKTHTIYLLHSVIGARRLDSGMTNTYKVQKEFYADKIKILNSNEAKFNRSFIECILTKKPRFKYMYFRLKQIMYIYFRNLDREHKIKYRQYKKYKNLIKEES